MYYAEEDYIKLIYELAIENDVELIKTSDLSSKFGYTDQSVNEMIKKLSQKGLVTFIPYKGIKLTENGLEQAIRMTRSHRIWEVFLTEKLGFLWQDVHEEAERLEHATSPRLVEKLFDYLGRPMHCSHGNPIPSIKGPTQNPARLSLLSLNQNESFKLTRVLDHKELLTFLNKNQINLGDTIKVVEKMAFEDLLKIDVNDKEMIISSKVADMLFGEI